MALALEDYGFIGDLQSAALVGRDGSVDWLCLPRFESGSCFAALLGTEQHGRWLLAPAGEVLSSSRRYRPGTLVLETEFETADGVVRVIDFMPRRGDGPPHLMRIVEGCRRAEFLAVEGTRRRFTLTWHLSYEQTPPVEDADSALARTEAWWREWSGRSRYRGAYTDEVLAFRDFLLRVSSGDPAQLQIMYGIAGERRLSEFELRSFPATRAPSRSGSATRHPSSSSSTSMARSRA